MLVRSNVYTLDLCLKRTFSTLGTTAVSITLELRLINSNNLVFCLFLNSIRTLMILRRLVHIQDTQLYSLVERNFPHCFILHSTGVVFVISNQYLLQTLGLGFGSTYS